MLLGCIGTFFIEIAVLDIIHIDIYDHVRFSFHRYIPFVGLLWARGLGI